MTHGRIAQLVEQGIENPRVGGSIPSPATFLSFRVPPRMQWRRALALAALLLLGCANDECELLCGTVASRLDACIEEWPTEWQALDSTGRAAYRRECQATWASVRSDLEPRELNDALQQCEEASVALTRMSRSESTCDQLRALYLLD